MMRLQMLAMVLLLLLPGRMFAQAAPIEPDIAIPDDLKPFWKLFRPARAADDEEALYKAVLKHVDQARQALDLVLDEISIRDRAELHDDARALAAGLDRLAGQERYMERVRFVLNLEESQRWKRHKTMELFNGNFAAINAARAEASPAAWEQSLRNFSSSADMFEALGDYEFAVQALRLMSECELAQNRKWESAQILKRMVALGDKLAFRDDDVFDARKELEALKDSGIDPDGPKPDDSVPAGEPGDLSGGAADDPAADGAGGTGTALTRFAAGSADQVFTLQLDDPKKGLAPVTLPSFTPLEQYLLWPLTWLELDGPSPFDSHRGLKLAPFDKALTLTRDGAKFSIDSNGDSESDLEFTPNSSPSRIEIPSPDGKSRYPLMVSVPGDRENMFSLEVNYSPQKETGARLRFNIAGSMDGKVLGEPWKLYDTNISGHYGDIAEWWNDGVTLFEEADQIYFPDMDSVLIGKSKVAIPWSAVLPVGEAFYRATISPDGTTLTLRQLDLQTGFVKLDINTPVQPTHVILKEVGALEGAYLNVVPAKKGGSVKVPVGTWQLAWGRFEQGHKTSMQQVRLYTGKSVPIEVKSGETATLALGGPFHIRALTRPDVKAVVLEGRSLRVYGKAQEEYAMFFDQPLQPEIEVRTADGKKVGKPEKMRKPELADWQTNTGLDNILWFPLDFRIDNAKGEKLQFRLTQKSQPLLGGPFDSDWTP